MPSTARRRRAPQRRLQKRERAGFTLVEVMVVVATLAVLASAALPKFMQYVYRSKRAEAIYGLRTIHDLELGYYAKGNEYSDSFEEIGVPLEGGELREDGSFQGRLYNFTLQTWDLGSRRNANYRATATANLDSSDETLDIVIIENQVLVHD